MNRRVRIIAMGFVALFVLLFAQINYLQVFAARRLVDNPANPRVLYQAYKVRRGSLLFRDRRSTLAYSKRTSGALKFLRVYPGGALYGQLTGYLSLVYGLSGLEASQNPWLSGTSPDLPTQSLVDQILGRPVQGATVVTTLDRTLQRVAARALGSLPGGVVAMDPATGEVLAMVSNPSFDPNPLASHDPEVERAAWRRLASDPDKPLVARAFQELFPPGSTFKLVTAAAALENGLTPDTSFPNPRELDLPQTTHALQNFGGEHCLGGAARLTLAQALRVSCNVVFGQIGLQIGAEAIVSQAEKFGFNQQVPFELPWAEGQIPPVSAFAQDLPGVAFSAIGQQSVRANPMAMALVAAAIANGGVEMVPRLVREARDPSGKVVKTFPPREYGRPISAQTAAELTAMMVDVVNAGTGTAAQIPGVEVAGKTGTAQEPNGNPDAWFVSFAPAQHPQIVVAVIVLNGGSLGSEATGGQVAAPIARAVMQAALAGA